MDKISLDTLEQFDIVVIGRGGKEVPIKDQVVSMALYEDIFQPLMTCEIVINDALALSQDLPFIGEETLRVTVKTTNAPSSSKYEFLLYGMDDVVPGDNNKYQVYKMRGISKESLADAKITVQRGYFDTHDAVINDVLSTFLKTKKEVIISPTKGVHRTIVPNLSPLTAIDFIRQRAVSNEYPYSPFLFFETASGFSFVDIVAQIVQAKQEDINLITRTFVNNLTSGTDGSGINSEKAAAFNSIISYQTVAKHDSISKTFTGAYYSNLNKFDLFTKEFTQVETRLNEVKGQFNLVTDGQFNSDEFVDDLSERGSVNYLVFQDGSRPVTHIDYFGQKQAYAALLFQDIVEAELHGDSTLEAGKVLYLDIKKATGLTDDQVTLEDDKQTGYYMISKLAHHITITNEPVMRTSCELVKGASKTIKERL
jgi:hypothetical protein